MLRRRKDRFFGRTLLRTNILLVSLFLVLGLLIVMFPFTYQLTRRLHATVRRTGRRFKTDE